MRLRRRLIQRQLRLLFIYPCIYMLLWVIPLVVNIMNYTDYFAQHPIFAIGILQLVCVTIMTFADVVVFCWRERPWRHIPGADGTFAGSFMFWRYCFGTVWIQDRRQSRVPSHIPDEKDTDDENLPTRLLSSLKRWNLNRKRSMPRGSSASGGRAVRPTMTHKRTYSGGSDRKEMEAERAHERLALERAAYVQNRRSFQERRLSAISQQRAASEKERKEWFDRQMGDDLFVDQDLDVDEKR
jgi:G protein-coupled receptor GPR1